jgi:hypothetical protein
LGTTPPDCTAVMAPCPASTFVDDCGCGCICPYDDPNRNYVSKNYTTCAVIDYLCAEGTDSFSDACGCGCKKSPCQPPPGMGCCSGDWVREGTCEDGGYVCPLGTQLRPLSTCVLPPWDGGPPPPVADAARCQPPPGFTCCDGGVPECPDGESIRCSNGGGPMCSLPPSPAADGGRCELPAGYECCRGNTIATVRCTDAGPACPPDYPMTPRDQCGLPQ